jgi:hypothetical protein
MARWRERTAVLGMALVAATASLTASQASSPPAEASPLTLSASCTGSGQATALHVRIDNRSSREVAFVFGRTIGSGPTNVIDALSVLTIRPATGATEAYPYVNPKHASLTGRATPWIVKVAAGGVYELDAPVEHFISGMTYTLLDPSALTGTRLQFEGRPAGAVKVWTGTIEAPIEC